MDVTRRLRKAILLTRALGASGKQNQYLRAGWSAAKTVGASARHNTHLLWLQVTGFFFAFFALIGITATIRQYNKWLSGQGGAGNVCLAIFFSMVFLYFASSSFWRARKLSKRNVSS